MAGMVVPCPDCGAGQTTEPTDAGRTVVCWDCAARFPAPGVPIVRPRRRVRRERREPVSPAAVLSFVLGVVSCLLFCVWPVTLGTGLVGVAAGVLGRRTASRRLAVAGLVLSATALVFAAGFLVLTVAGVSVFEPPGAKSAPPFFPLDP